SLSWSANNNPSWTRYEVSYSTDNFVLHFATAVRLSDNWVETSTTIFKLASGTNYKFRIRAFNQSSIPTDFVEFSTTTDITGNLLLNEFFEEWVITSSSESAKYWSWTGTPARLKRKPEPLVGDYSAEITITAKNKNLEQNFIDSDADGKVKTYYGECWVKGSGVIKIGIKQPGYPSASYSSPIVLSNSNWTKIQYSIAKDNRSGTDGEFVISSSYTVSGEVVYIGAAWLSDSPPPSSWPPIPPPDTTPPDAISNLTALPGVKDGEVLLSWTSPGDDGNTGTLNNAFYRIKYSTTVFTFFSSTESYSIQFGTTGVFPNTSVSYVVSGLNPGTTYYFGIITQDDAGNWSNWTKDDSAGINTANYSWAMDLPPKPPVNILASGINRAVELSWSTPSPDPGDIDKYWIYRATFSFDSLTEGGVIHIATVPYPAAHTTITGLTNGVTYYYRIKTLDKGDEGNGLFSIVLESKLSDIVSAIPRLRPANNLVATHRGTSVSLSWLHSVDYSEDNFVGYNIYRSEISEAGPFNFVGSVAKVNNFVDTVQVIANKTYYYIVRSSDTGGVESVDSNVATAIPDLLPPEFVLVEKLTSRSLGKPLARINLKVVDDRFIKDDREGNIISLTGKFRKINDLVEKNITFIPELVSGANEYLGEAEFDFSIIQIGTEGVEYYLVAKDEVNISSWPVDGGWYKVELPTVLPEQKFISEKNPEVVFGKEVEEVIIRDYSGNEIWKGSSDGGTKLIIWRGEDKQNKKIESGGYIYEIKTRDGKRKYGVAIIVK
ncbi:MAG: fibronectin type III domain-containing protein, partial [Endomicrobiia bacterium]